AHPIGWDGADGLSEPRRRADNSGVTVTTDTLVAARSRAHGTTPPLWHAVEVHRAVTDLDGACELTVCGALARVTGDLPWPPAAAGEVCPACSAQLGC
ncbi:hypothetical protein, partial [Modestobacter roseus]